MECPKCHRKIPDNSTVCPHCRKVIALECPNCHSLGESSICEKCGYIILAKCAKCGNVVSTNSQKCKCGFPVKTSIAFQECENDEFAALVIRFSALKNIRRLLGSQELFTKFFYRLRNLLIAQLSGVDGRIINYNDVFVVNMNKELSFPTSTQKAVRLAIKITNAFAELNSKVIEQLGTPLKLNITIIKKQSEDLLKNVAIDSNVKLLTVKKNEKKYLKGMQIILDQFVCDNISKDFKTDSLYSIEKNGESLMYYEILLESYILPPSVNSDDKLAEVQQCAIEKAIEEENTEDMFRFKVFDINAKCKFEKVSAATFFDKFQNNKIIAIRGDKELNIDSLGLIEFFKKQDSRVVHVVCTEEMAYKPWGFFEKLFKDYYNLSFHKDFISPDFDIKRFKPILDLIKSISRKASSPEDARFAYMEDFTAFFASLKNCTILIENFEHIDDTSIQTLNLYFDKYKNIAPQFVFTMSRDVSLHSKFKSLLRTTVYTEYTLQKSGIAQILSEIKEEASDFINSFYFEKIKENFKGSKLYFDNAIKHLLEKDVLINFENRLIIKNNNSILLPATLEGLLKARLKCLSKNMDASMILAYSSYLGERIDFNVLAKLGIKHVSKSVKTLVDAGFGYVEQNVFYVTNYNILKPVIEASLKKEINEFLSKNILATLGNGLDGTTLLLLFGKIAKFKEEYLLLWKNAQFAISTGDYDAYLKNSLGSLSLIEHIENNIPAEDIEENKKEVYQNILMSLYNYSPEKICALENILLIDAINANDNDKIVKLSNLMLQGALISSNYTDALSLLHNILSRMQNPTLLTDGVVNTKFLLLSLVNIEILFNIGDFAQCVDIAKDILGVLKLKDIDKFKPANFSTNLFMEHIMETFRLAALAKLLLMDDELEDFFEAIKVATESELPDKECILAIRDFINGKNCSHSFIENSSAFAKIIYLILQEFTQNKDNPKVFAQNIYQAKLLAVDIKQTQLEMLCDLLIAHSYAKLGIKDKAMSIYNDILEKSEKSAIFNISTLAKYFIARLDLENNEAHEALLIINDTLAELQKYNNQAKILYVLLEKLFLDTAKNMEIESIDIASEEQKLMSVASDGRFARLL